MEGSESQGWILWFIVALAPVFYLILLAAVRAGKKSPRLRYPDKSRSALTRQLQALHARHGGELGSTRLIFQHGDVEVTIDVNPAQQDMGGDVRLLLRKGLVPITLGPEATFSGNDIRTGDPEFDGVVKVGGDPYSALAVLTPETRRLVQRAILAGLRMIDDGDPCLTIRTSGDDVERMLPHLELGLALAPLLGPPTDPQILLTRLRTEPLPEARLAIAMQAPPASLEAHLAELARLPEPEVRLALATRLDQAALWASLSQAELLATLRDERPGVQHMAIDALGRFGTIEAVPALEAKKAYDRKTRDLATDAIRAIQSRATGSRGDLALATHDGGLSLSANEPRS